MAKLVVLKIIDGNFEQGFTVMQEIGEDNKLPSSTTLGKLPPLPEMPLYYSRWKESYGRLKLRYRIAAKKGQKLNVSVVNDCDNASKILKARLNTWFLAEDYRSVREKWLQQLSPEDEIRILIQTEDSQMRALPWNVLEFLEGYPHAEIAISALNLDHPPQRQILPKPRVNILSIVGNSEGIDTDVDQGILDQLPQTAIERLIAPDRKTLTDQLWNTPWDILFFAGHSTSQDGKGRIFHNQTDSLTMGELKYALQKSVVKGLQLAIFNSCDGLEIARELAELNIPQIIVMREPVPDLVAQEFLAYFLNEYTQGTSLYLAVRAARERLQGMEDRFPCATWLPLICQNPMVSPPLWRDFLQSEPIPAPTPAAPPAPTRLPVHHSVAIALLTSFTTATLVGAVRFFGLLQPIELAAFDHLMRLRPPEPTDSRLLVVAIDGEDLQQQSRTEDLKGTSISDRNLAKLLNMLMKYKPRAIGLDVSRDRTQLSDLTAQFRHNESLISVCKVGDKTNPYGIAPQPDIPLDSFRIGFSDFTGDGDGSEIIRRHLLGTNAKAQQDSLCQVSTAFSVELALKYLQIDLDLEETGFYPPAGNETFIIWLKRSPKDFIPVPHGYASLPPPTKEAIFPSLPLRLGGYQGQDLDGRGSQILLNYRAGKDLRDIATQKSLSWFISQENPPLPQALEQLIRDKVVLIGVTAREKDDYHKTPYGNSFEDSVPGVFIHAHMLSQLLSAVLDGRPLLWAWSPWGDWGWIVGWSSLGGLVAWGVYRRHASHRATVFQFALGLGVATGVLYTACAGCLIVWAGWLPLVPSVLGLWLGGTGVTLVLSRHSHKP